ncbi:hypothetical protein ACFRMQ_04690 [Kitasatospora sp. NPDC056783]|uniref:hypothetical protein n=1 Tax=Kitasatospora sp. NPDC056783 TaxID=3345943 RepID=UPI003694038B
MSAIRPIHPRDPAIRHLTGRDLTQLIVELRTEGRELGLLWPSAKPGETVLNGQILVSLGSVPASTLINLLSLVREFRRGRP